MKTYQQVKNEIAENTNKMDLFEKLHFEGISYKNVHYYVTPPVSSNYSMGEQVDVRCKNRPLEKVDHRQYYAKSCKWQPKHGYIVIDFDKKGLKDYVNLCKKLNGEMDLKTRVDLINERQSLVRKYVKTEFCEFKNSVYVG